MKLIDFIFLNKETRDFLKACAVRPPWRLLRATSRAIRNMKKTGLWDNIECWYDFSNGGQSSLINWKNPKEI